MVDEDFTNEEHEGRDVYDAEGNRVGTVRNVDEEGNRLHLDPDREVSEETWNHLDWDQDVDHDTDWYQRTQFKSQVEGSFAEEYDQWPFTVGHEDIDEVDEDRIHLRRPGDTGG